MFNFGEIERCYDVCGGVDGLYDDPNDGDMVITCKNGIVSKFPKIILNHPMLNRTVNKNCNKKTKPTKNRVKRLRNKSRK